MKKGLNWRDVLGWAALFAITALAAWLRFTQLDLKPMHHDEGVNAWFTKRLVEEFHYQYNPFYYHGPLLYFLTAPFLLLKGYSAESMRLAPALFGTLVVPAFALVRARIGWVGVLAAALVMAIAPVEVYFSRTAIHEIYNGVFNVTLVAGFYLWWRDNSRPGLYLSAASLALLFATKETTAITLAAVAPALLAVAFAAKDVLSLPGGAALPFEVVQLGPGWWRRRMTAGAGEPWPGSAAPTSVQRASERLQEAMAALQLAAAEANDAYAASVAQAQLGRVTPPPQQKTGVAHLARGGKEPFKVPLVSFILVFLRALWRHDPGAMKMAVVVFVIFWGLLFSSFFSNPLGIGSFFAAFFGWGQTGVEGKGHEKIWYCFFDKLLWPYYKPLLFVGAPALIWGCIRRDAFSIFNTVWFVLAAAAYSIIPYKTPWCSISFVTPLFFGVGIGGAYVVAGAEWLARRARAPALKPLLVALPLLASAYPMWTFYEASYKIQFEEYDVDGHHFIYVQNVREFMDLVKDLDGVLTAAEDAGIETHMFILRAKNPLRWYLVDHDFDMDWIREFKEDRVPDMQDADIIVAQRSRSKELKDKLDLDQFEQRWYHERPGQKFDVYVRKGVWQQYLAAVDRGDVPPPTGDPVKRTVSDDRTKQMRDAERALPAGQKKPAQPQKPPAPPPKPAQRGVKLPGGK